MTVLLFKQTDQPAVRSGNIAASVASVLQASAICLILFLSTRDGHAALPSRVDSQEPDVPSLPSEEKARSAPETPLREWDGKAKV